MSPDASPPPDPSPVFSIAHAPRDVVAATCTAARSGVPATLAIVLETDGSTYVSQGAAALFGAGAQQQVGWLSGGCLEPEIAHRADVATRSGRIGWIEIDTRDDEDLLAGSALGCRGRLRIALLPIAAMPGIEVPLQAWHAGRVALRWRISARGDVALEAGTAMRDWSLPAEPPAWAGADTWRFRFDAPPELLVCGAGPETMTLLPLLRTLGWRTTLAERRARWAPFVGLADRRAGDGIAEALHAVRGFDAALVMHHNFELDREALELLAASDIAFVGLLGPGRRRDDLFRVLSPDVVEMLRPRLRSPVGIRLGGQGAEAIALSIAAQLQAWRYGIDA